MSGTCTWKDRLPWIIAWGLLILVFAWIISRQLRPQTLFFLEDQALTLAVSQRLLEGEVPLVGPPSHIGGRHLGPLVYYLNALALWFGGGDAYAGMLAAALLNLLSLAVVLLTVSMLVFHRRPLVLFGTGLCLAATRYTDVFRFPWQSHMLFLPVSLLLLSALLVMRHGARFLPLLVLLSGLCIQAHFSSAPLVIFVVLACLILLFRRRDFPPVWGIYRHISGARWNAAWLILAALSWIPLIIYEIRYGGAVSGLISGWGSRSGQSGLYTSLVNLVHFLRLFIFGDWVLWLSPQMRWLALTPPVCAFLFLLYRYCKFADFSGKLFHGVLLACAILYVLILSRDPGPLHIYYLYPLLPIPALLAGCALAGIFSTGPRKLPVAAGCLIAASFLLSLYAAVLNSGHSIWNIHSLQHALEVAQALKQDSGPADSLYIKTHGSVTIMRDSYYFFLGRNYFPLMNYAGTLLEMPSFRTPPVSNRGYVISCPWPASAHLENLKKGLLPEWELAERIAPADCPTCRMCMIFRLNRPQAS